MTHDPHHPEDTPDEPLPLTKSPTLMGRLRRAFGRAAPGGASSTPSPTQGRTSGVSAPGVAETAQRQGAPDQEVGAEGGPDPDTLHAVQREILRPARAAETAAGEPAVKSAQPTIRRFTGDKRTVRVGPLRFTGDEHAEPPGGRCRARLQGRLRLRRRRRPRLHHRPVHRQPAAVRGPPPHAHVPRPGPAPAQPDRRQRQPDRPRPQQRPTPHPTSANASTNCTTCWR